MSDNWLIIPIETKIRELYGKSLLAVCAAEAGMQVILGDQRVVSQSLHHLPRGLYVDKSIARTKINHFRRLRRMGSTVVAWCEEGLAYRDKSAYQLERVDQQSMAEVDAFFAWGNSQSRDVLEKLPEAADKTHVFGNPRFDFLQPSLRTVFDHDVGILNSAYGRYVLVNTNFSRYNRFQGRHDVVDVLRARGILSKDEQKPYYQRSVEHLGEVFRFFADAVPKLAAAFPDITFIVRPHPSENHDRWRSEMAGQANIQVNGDGNAIPWMMGAQAVIHNACTTGVESFLLDRPTIAYVPVVHETFNRLSYLPNAVSRIARDMDELSEAVRCALAQERPFDAAAAEKRKLVSEFVANASGESAAENIVRTLGALNARPKPSVWREQSARLLSFARSKAARARRAVRPDEAMRAYLNQKFPDLTLGELEKVMNRIAVARGRGFAPQITPYPGLPSCFLIRGSAGRDAEHSEEPELSSAV
jgi:surface carbohydrate biosynthesis protein